MSLSLASLHTRMVRACRALTASDSLTPDLNRIVGSQETALDYLGRYRLILYFEYLTCPCPYTPHSDLSSGFGRVELRKQQAEVRKGSWLSVGHSHRLAL